MGSGGAGEQQFCLRWHNYQSSLLATLPLLLDGDDLTDVTLCAGGKSLKAHRVVLSACSQYFKDLFKEMQPLQHPVIVVPGAEFNDLCALVTFMYSGEVNIYQHQLSSLLTMADTLHIRGLAEFTANPSFLNSSVGDQRKSSAAEPANNQPRSKRAKMMTSATEDLLLFPAATTKPPSSSSSSLLLHHSSHHHKPKTHKPAVKPDPEIIASYWDTFGQHMAEDLSQRVNSSGGGSGLVGVDEGLLLSSADLLMSQQEKQHQQVKQEQQEQDGASPTTPPGPPSTTPPDNNNTYTQPTDLTQGNSMEPKLRGSQNSGPGAGGGSKLYATCFVCGKQLSNQYNLRVHMETHQNAHYACTVCSHVSRSRDALRKHVSYRHPQTAGGGGDAANTNTSAGNRSRQAATAALQQQP
ncbi:broad-complex core protein isoforms 1/2/3/4/5 isoform X1 [Nilaparvata lugens]|uniref:broad-complex core protein isoforms 1/2/3/4/5 isoform X1 n=1 Tax=Nilaparvata lugens TaxID=108931 RepID=UPI00193CDBD1|nr:broad-complex core protein isoforms 1/2/3/4/5 isoform X1 [Nilaparvata lugens]XP_039282570.1 broad-complex core protein isoforms 1/2/3/4/5 isoform X2 [Nilaparvata lugens]XP_039282572.1 broad-complex core protein isoforms 1/2/3/4/5 isoform X1 [Nilaparvata lugens]XP_039282573.1 broad-complex core protein isoforms 1/2/3/4/5 isoform X1 [Nilaparvata lugens]